jgi:hypothetical protein
MLVIASNFQVLKLGPKHQYNKSEWIKNLRKASFAKKVSILSTTYACQVEKMSQSILFTYPPCCKKSQSLLDSQVARFCPYNNFYFIYLFLGPHRIKIFFIDVHVSSLQGKPTQLSQDEIFTRKMI